MVGWELAARTAIITVAEVPPPEYEAPPRGLAMEKLTVPGETTKEAAIVAVT
jgi:hypothetical protein